MTVQLFLRILSPSAHTWAILSMFWLMYQWYTVWFSELAQTQTYTRLLASGLPVPGAIAELTSPITNQRFAPQGRLSIWRTALIIFRAHPLFGIGPDNFHFDYGAYLNLTTWDMGVKYQQPLSGMVGEDRDHRSAVLPMGIAFNLPQGMDSAVMGR